jgi:hypothetical protein
MEHMDQHALTIPISCGQTLKLLSQRTDISLIHSGPLYCMISLTGQLSHLHIEPLDFSVVVPLKLMTVIVGLAKCTNHMPQTAFYSIKSPHYCERGAHCRIVTVLPFHCSNLQRSFSSLLLRVSGGIAPQKDPSHSSCQLLWKMVHNVL